ncbi:hypothetical protein MD484_g4056, partial [Candolleomyces efflorescens]
MRVRSEDVGVSPDAHAASTVTGLARPDAIPVEGVVENSYMGTVEIGTGLRWDDVYAALEPHNGGFVTLTCPQAISKLVEATARFSSEVKDPKASVTSTFSSHEGNPSGSFQLFYDGPNPPAGIFDDFLALHTATTDISTRSLLSLVQSINANETYGERSYFDMVPVVDYSPGFLELVRNTSIVAGRETSAFTLYLVAEPFLPTILSHNPSRTAYPFNRSKVYTPFGIVVLWRDPADDEVAAEAVKRIKDTLYTALIAEGQRDIVDAPLYTNYVIYDTPVERIYGSNLPALKRLKARVDPTNVMGLAGGFKV